MSRNRFRSRRRRKPGEGREKGRQNKLIPPFILSPSGAKGGRDGEGLVEITLLTEVSRPGWISKDVQASLQSSGKKYMRTLSRGKRASEALSDLSLSLWLRTAAFSHERF